MNAVYESTQIQAAQHLLELLTPPELDIDAVQSAFQAALADIDDEEAPIYALLYQALGKEGAFFAIEDDSAALADSLAQVSQAWGANLLFGARDWEGYDIPQGEAADLLAIAALELRAYDLCLWQWDGGEEILTGFISRLADVDLIEKLAEQCQAELWQTEEMV